MHLGKTKKLLISTERIPFSFRQKTNVMSNLGSSYTKILGLLHELESRDNYLSQIRTPKLSDKQLIALVFAAESLGLDSERHLFRQLPSALDGLIDRSVFNRRRRQLAVHIEHFRQHLLNDLAPSEDTYFVDSMPLEVCKLGRAKRLRICQETEETRPDFGYCAAHKTYYFGYKLHAVCTPQGVIKTFDLSKASTHDIHYLDDLKTQLQHCVLVGDKVLEAKNIVIATGSDVAKLRGVDTDGKRHNWRNDLAQKLLSLQDPDGSWVNKDSPRWWQNNPQLVTAFSVNALNMALK